MKMIDRRSFIQKATKVAGGGTIIFGSTVKVSLAKNAPSNPVLGVKALFFDMFGTILDWRTGVAHSVEKILKPLGYSLDWFEFADEWRSHYGPGMEEVRSGRTPYVSLDAVHRRMLNKVMSRFEIRGLPDKVMEDINLSWHRLDVWPDVANALPRLHSEFLLAPVSNANISMIANVVRRNNISFDAVLGADIARDFKPKAIVYQASAEAFALEPEQCMLVSAASHNVDMKGAASAGLKVAAIERPDEHGAGKSPVTPKVPVDMLAKDLNDLADQLGV